MITIPGLEGGVVPSTALAVIPVIIFIAYLIAFPVSMDPQEPRLVRPTIPFIGHIVGLFQHSWRYLYMVHAKNPAPILTLPMLNGKVYVVSDPDLTLVALRNRSLSFDPFLSDIIQGMTKATPETMSIYNDPAFFGAWIKIIYGGMAGQSLLHLNLSALGNIADRMNAIDGHEVQVEDLYLWNRELLTLASTDSLYGSKNPLKADKSLIDAYWDFEANVHKLMPGILPSLVAPRGHRGKKRLQQALTEYFDAHHDEGLDVPPLVRDRRKLSASFNMTSAAAAGIELMFIHGAISNTFPTYYWFFTRVFSQPALVARLRAEAQGVLEEKGRAAVGGEEKRVVTLHFEKIEERCPLLMSCFRETHRLSAEGILVRKVLADTTISDGKTTYALKKDWQLQAPQKVLQTSPEIWGEDAAEFVGDRFLNMAEEKGEAVVNFAARGFIAFGAGKHICPGRYFASGELLGSLALLVAGFDVISSEGDTIQVPKASGIPLTGSIGKPVAGDWSEPFRHMFANRTRTWAGFFHT